jgi:succinate dehydrogenase / fumarate reductase flavoprotein subunit
LQETMQANVGIVRRREEMEKALTDIAEIRRQVARVAVGGNREYNPGWHTALDLDNLVTAAEAVALSALERKESRGAQYREDYPDKDPEWGRMNVVVRKGADGAMEVQRVPIPELPAELKQIIEEMG